MIIMCQLKKRTKLTVCLSVYITVSIDHKSLIWLHNETDMIRQFLVSLSMCKTRNTETSFFYDGTV
jgi:hypothetical protein